MKGAIVIFFALIFFLSVEAQPAENQIFTDFLSEHVVDGMVDYSSACFDDRLENYIDHLSWTDPQQISDQDAALAFWINAYNAYTLKIICDHYPLKSINELHTGGLILGSVIGRTVWHRRNVVINQERTSLHIIEHEIIRKAFNEPRIHFALVCAAKGCPPLRREAFEGERLDAQLQDQGIAFFRQKEKNRIDINSRTVYLSPIFSWFRRDFGRSRDEMFAFILPFLEQRDAQALKEDFSSWRVRYTHYDWSLNEQ